MSTVCGALTSNLVGEELSYRVILPQLYQRSRRKYPVLYLLHGLFGNCENWIEFTELEQIASRGNLIVVTPEGKDSWYVDSFMQAQSRYESYIVEELIPDVEGKFGIDARRETRAIAGNSMGGYGAIKFGLKYPSQFVFAGSFSGAFEAPHLTYENPGTHWDHYETSIMEAFGPAESPVRWENDLFALIDKMSALDVESVPEMYTDCGADDQFINANRELSKVMTRKGIRHEFQELPGGHDWDYWGSRLRHLIEKLGQLPGW